MMSEPARKIPTPRKSQPSTFMRDTLLLLLGRADRRDVLLDALGIRAVLDVRVVRVERGTLRADTRDPVEVVPRRRAGGRPLQRGGVTPWVFFRDVLAVPGRDVHVPEEQQHRQRQQPGTDR